MNTHPHEGNRLFPVFLKLQHLETLLVGGGKVALEKLRALLGNCPEAKIVVVADRISKDIVHLAATYPSVTLIKRPFQETDIDGMSWIILATDRPGLHEYISELAKERGIWLNVADTPALCDVYLGSVVQKGNLKIGISTNGKSPTMAIRLKELLQSSIPDEVEETLQHLYRLRETLQGDFKEKVKILNALTASITHSQTESIPNRYRQSKKTQHE